jgi:hypothetical protein
MANQSITYDYEKIYDSERRVYRTVIAKDNTKTIGRFIIEGMTNSVGECFGTGHTCSMSISIDDTYQGRGITRPMILYMIQMIEKEYPQIYYNSNVQQLYIDGDGSDGFWDRIGMIDHRYGYDTKRESKKARTLEGYGYEKVITYQKLKNFALGVSGGYVKKCRTRRNKRRTHRKRRTSRRT